MLSPSTQFRTWSCLVLGLIGAVVAAPAAKALVESTIYAGAENYDFARVFRRLVQGFIVLAILWQWRVLAIGARVRRATDPSDGAWRGFFSGVMIATVAVLIFAWGCWLTGDYGSSSTPLTAGACARAFYLATVVSITEEFLFNILLLDVLLEKGRPWRAMVLRSLAFALVHLLRVRLKVHADLGEFGWNPWIGFEVLSTSLAPLVNDSSLDCVLELVALFLLGMTASLTYVRTGRIFLACGIHWGLVFGLRLDRHFLEPVRTPSFFFESSSTAASSPAGILLLILLLSALTLFLRPSVNNLGLAAGASREGGEQIHPAAL